jgi:ectoine hydroxylase
VRLSEPQLITYNAEGFLHLPNHFSRAAVATIAAQLPSLFAADTPARVMEQGGGKVRAIHGSHATNEALRQLACHPALVVPAMQILKSKVYVFQFKINAKVAFDGDVWPWHQDFVFWRYEDGMPTPRAVTAVVFLNEVTEFNGPLFLCPGSHKNGEISHSLGTQTSTSDPTSWVSNVSANLKYSLEPETIKKIVAEHGLVAAKGESGSTFFFHPNMVHGSAPNISPFDRTLALITYNSIDNMCSPTENPRPDFLVTRRCVPLEPEWTFTGKI